MLNKRTELVSLRKNNWEQTNENVSLSAFEFRAGKVLEQSRVYRITMYVYSMQYSNGFRYVWDLLIVVAGRNFPLIYKQHTERIHMCRI
jgi:hypothetical protein